MTRNALIGLTIVAFCQSGAFAQEGRTAIGQREVVTNINKTDQLGVGLQVGSFSGVNAEYWWDADRTLNMGVAFERNNTVVTASHNWMFRGIFNGEASNFVPFIGAGALGAWGNQSDYFSRKNGQNFAFALQAPLGVSFLPKLQRFGIYAEVAPSLQLSPNSVGFLSGDIGARFYF